MAQANKLSKKSYRWALITSLVSVLLVVAAFPALSARGVKDETIEATAMGKMHAVGHISITGTLGYDLAYIRMIPTPTGRKIRFVTNRLLRFGEVWADTQSTAFNLTGGEFDLNDTDKSKSTGVLYPACQLAIDKQGQLQIELNQNAWNLVDVLDWKGTPGVN